MEKYSKWRDKATGVHPFLPPKAKSGESNFFLSLKSYLLGPLFALVKLPFIIVVVSWLILMFIISELIPIPPFKRFFIRYTQVIGIRFLLFLMGFYWINTKYSKLEQRLLKDTGYAVGADIKPGDIIIANHCSYIDVLYLMFRYSPVFSAQPLEHLDSEKFLVRNGLQSFLDSIYDVPSIIPNFDKDALTLKKISEYAKSCSAPVVIFPEATTSNGRSVLTCPKIFEDADFNVHILGFKYEYENFAPVFTIGNSFFHFFQLCGQFANSLEVRYLHPAEVTKLKAEPETFTLHVNNAMATILRVHKVALSARDKREFKDYWYGHTKVYQKKEQ